MAMNSQVKRLCQVPEKWLSTLGYDANIGIIDSNCEIKNVNIKHAIKKYNNFGIIGHKEHGTHVTGIICSDSKNIYNGIGLSTKANIYFNAIKINSDGGHEYLLNALNNLPSNIDVINLSIAYSKENLKIKSKLFELYEKGVIVNCAYSNIYGYPHSYESVISVGNEQDKNADINTQDRFISTSDLNGYIRMNGTSMGTAFVSSIAGCAKSYNKAINKSYFLNSIIGDKFLELDINKNILNNNEEKQIILRF